MEQAQGKETYHVLVNQDQKETQTTKTRTRTMSEYNGLIFEHSWDSETDMSEKTDRFIDNYCGFGVKNMEQLIDRVFDLRQRPVIWAEMGGGGAIAMRQITSLVGREKLATFNVDLVDFDDKTIDHNALREIAKITPKALRPENKPELIRENIEEVKLPQKVDLITSVASVFYLNNPVEAICNWYNQLSDYGLLVITSEEKWSEWVRFEGSKYFSDSGPLSGFLDQLRNSGIAFATSGDKRFNLMVIEKKPDTKLELQAEVAEIWISPDHRKAVYYKNDGQVISVNNDDGIETKKNQEYYDNISRLLQIAKDKKDDKVE